MLAAALLGSLLALAPAAPEDPVIRDVLVLVERTHLGAARSSPEALLRAAAESLRRADRGVSVAQDGGALLVRQGEREIRVEVAEGASLAERAGPGLEALARFGAESAGEQQARALVLDGALRALDRWSSARSGRRRSDQEARRTGERGVIGVRIGRRDGEIRVLGVLRGSGAEAAGVRAGDVLLSVAGAGVEGRSVSEILGSLRGTPGTTVEVTLKRLAPEPLSIERRTLREPSVKARLESGGLAVVAIDHVSTRSPGEVREALASLSKDAPPRAIVLDLRGNSGGSMLGAAGIADLFVAEGILAEALDDADRPVPGLRARVEATPGGDLATPLVVLVDRRTASSAELLAAALAWHGRARIAGERTFGKIVVGKPHAFPDADLTVTITSAIMRAAGRRLPADGLEPDIALDPRAPGVFTELIALLAPDPERER